MDEQSGATAVAEKAKGPGRGHGTKKADDDPTKVKKVSLLISTNGGPNESVIDWSVRDYLLQLLKKSAKAGTPVPDGTAFSGRIDKEGSRITNFTVESGALVKVKPAKAEPAPKA